MVDAEKLKAHVYDIVGALHAVHDELGAGVNEYCYQEALGMELSDRGIPFEREKSFHPSYKGRPMNAEYRVDFLCKGDVIDGKPFIERTSGAGELARAPLGSCP